MDNKTKETLLKILEIMDEMQRYTNCTITTNAKLMKLKEEISLTETAINRKLGEEVE